MLCDSLDRKHNPEKLDLVGKIAKSKSASTAARFAKLLGSLIAKYPASISIEKDAMQQAMEDMMRQHAADPEGAAAGGGAGGGGGGGTPPVDKRVEELADDDDQDGGGDDDDDGELNLDDEDDDDGRDEL